MSLADRLLSGEPSEHDREWLAWLWGYFAELDLDDLHRAGMAAADARAFVALIALHPRFARTPDERLFAVRDRPARGDAGHEDVESLRRENEQLKRENEVGHRTRIEMGLSYARIVERLNECAGRSKPA